jgi:hypothetical protein
MNALARRTQHPANVVWKKPANSRRPCIRVLRYRNIGQAYFMHLNFEVLMYLCKTS